MGKFSITRGWTLRGWDTFAGEPYHIGRYFTEGGARRAARRYLTMLEKNQPPEFSGGRQPGGIQDKVSIVRPDGTEFQLPESAE
jgi:hypothetical protein